MEFYKIGQVKGKYILQEDDEQAASKLTQEQMGLLADRLGSMYHAKDLVLTLRKYIMLYYTNDEKEYVSLDDIPSLVVCPARLSRRFADEVMIEGIAITFLDGEEENRVMLSPTGEIEARGVSIIEVWQMLDDLIDSLNRDRHEDVTLWTGRSAGSLTKLRQKILKYGQKNSETNLAEISWYWAEINGAWHSIDITKDEPAITKAIFELPTAGGHLQLWAHDDGQIALIQRRYAWQCLADTAVWRGILQALALI